MRTKKSRIRRRNLFVEGLEERRLLAGIVGDGSSCDLLPNLDSNGDGYITAQDVLFVVSEINRTGVREVSPFDVPNPDVNWDGYLTAADVLGLVNELNRSGASSMEDLLSWRCDNYTYVTVGNPPRRRRSPPRQT